MYHTGTNTCGYQDTESSLDRGGRCGGQEWRHMVSLSIGQKCKSQDTRPIDSYRRIGHVVWQFSA